MIPDWQTNSVVFSSLLPGRHPSLWLDLHAVLHRHGVPVRLIASTRDIWVRDFLPLQIERGRFVHFAYRPDYLRGFEHLQTGSEVRSELPNLDVLKTSELVVDGGNIVAAPGKVIATDKIFRENPGMSKAQLIAALRDSLEIDEVIVIPADPDDEIGHADGVVRFLDQNLVAVSDFAATNRRYWKQVTDVLARHHLEMAPLPFFFEEQECGGISSAVGNYVNFLRVEDLVLVPAYGHMNDEIACRQLETALSGATSVPIPCTQLAREGGVLNCVSWTLLQ